MPEIDFAIESYMMDCRARNLRRAIAQSPFESQAGTGVRLREVWIEAREQKLTKRRTPWMCLCWVCSVG